MNDCTWAVFSSEEGENHENLGESYCSQNPDNRRVCASQTSRSHKRCGRIQRDFLVAELASRNMEKLSVGATNRESTEN